MGRPTNALSSRIILDLPMPRRRRFSPLDDLMNALALLPWWACLIVALAAYLGLHAIATRPLPPILITTRIDNLPGVMYGSALRALASAGQVIVPVVALVAALMSFIGRRKRRELFLHATEGGAPAAAIDAMSWRDFELLIAEGFRLQGFTVAEKGGAGADGGVDMEIMKDGERWLVQAKHWRARQVPVEVVRELAGVMPFRRAVGGYIVTSGRFTGPAQDFARGRGITLVSGSMLDDLLRRARASLDSRPNASSPTPHKRGSPVATSSEATSPVVPRCPTCGKPMVVRKARKGANAGAIFWGCSDYPTCKGTRPV